LDGISVSCISKQPLDLWVWEALLPRPFVLGFLSQTEVIGMDKDLAMLIVDTLWDAAFVAAFVLVIWLLLI